MQTVDSLEKTDAGLQKKLELGEVKWFIR